MAREIVILGSTGSIGRQTLQVAGAFPDKLKVGGLSANVNIELLEEQVRKFKPGLIAVKDEGKAGEIKKRLRDLTVNVLAGEEGINELAAKQGAELVLVALVGFSGLAPTLTALEAGKAIALANKETLVAGGELVMKKAREKNTVILPVDSEHSAIFQCLRGGAPGEVKNIVLTASGGPFLGFSREELKRVTAAEALKHPNWDMGAKVTIDSATLMNKGFEVIEARWLFDLDYSQIDVVVHPESIIHSMVHFVDGSHLAQMSPPSMLLPIQYALSYPERWKNNFPRLNWGGRASLTFLPPERDSFPCLDMAYLAGRKGGTMPAVLNAANELAVESFLKGALPFLHIPDLLNEVMQLHTPVPSPDYPDIAAADRWAREETGKIMQNAELRMQNWER